MPGECDRHQDCMERIHTSINSIKEDSARASGAMEEFTKSVNEFLVSIRKDVYAPNGIIEKVGNHTFQLTLQWALLASVVIAVLIEYFKK